MVTYKYYKTFKKMFLVIQVFRKKGNGENTSLPNNRSLSKPLWTPYDAGTNNRELKL